MRRHKRGVVVARRRTPNHASPRSHGSGLQRFDPRNLVKPALSRAWQLRTPLVVLGTFVGLLGIAVIWGFSGSILGGDDSHLYYPFPSEWSSNFGRLSWISTFSGYNPQYFFLPFDALLSLIHATGLNGQVV